MKFELKHIDAGGRKIFGRTASAWLKLAAGVGIILPFMFWLGPALMQLPGYAAMARFIDENNIRASAIYYTDIEEFAEAEAAMRDRLRLPPEAGSSR